MAKSKFVQSNAKIAKSVTTGFQKIQKAVVGTYTKIEDQFVDQYLTHEGETVTEAKSRLKQEQQEREHLI